MKYIKPGNFTLWTWRFTKKWCVVYYKKGPMSGLVSMPKKYKEAVKLAGEWGGTPMPEFYFETYVVPYDDPTFEIALGGERRWRLKEGCRAHVWNYTYIVMKDKWRD